jgi:RHS repeat-associated protein
MVTFDANGDGKDDVLYKVFTNATFQTEVHLLLSQAGPGLVSYQDIVVGGTGMGTPLDEVNLGGSRAVDLDGDGRVDLLTHLLFEYPVDLTPEDGLPPPEPDDTRDTYQPVHWSDVDQKFHTFGASIKANRINMVDANGDSLLDVVGFTEPDNHWIALSRGDGTFHAQGTITSPATSCPIVPLGGDLDADGRGELLLGTANDCSTSVTVGTKDTGAVVATPSLPVRRGERAVQLADLNGDGLVDALWLGDVLEISFNTGNGFGPPQIISDPALDSVFAMNQDWHARSAIVMDVDRDGRDDLLFTLRDVSYYDWPSGTNKVVDKVVALLSRGDGSFRREDISVEPGSGLKTGDFDGDGRQDLLTVLPGGVLTMYLQQGNDGGDRLSGVWDDSGPGLSNPYAATRLTVGYGRTNPADWAGSTCTFPTLCLRRSAEVVAWVAGLDVGTQTFYRFEEPRIDLQGRGFLGYATVRVWDPARPMERTTTFDNVTRVGTIYPNAQRPKLLRTVVPLVDHGPEGVSDKIASGSARISETIFNYGLRRPQGGPSHFVFTQTTHEREWEEEVTIDWTVAARVHLTDIAGPRPEGALRRHNASFEVDDYDNLLSVNEATVGGVVHTAIQTYDIRPAEWLVGLLLTKVEASYEGAQTPDWIHLLNHHDSLGRLDTSTVEPGGDPDLTVARSLVHDGRGRLVQETRTAAGQPARVRHFAYNDPSGEGVFLSQQWDEVDSAIVLSKWMFAVPGFGGTMGIIDANGGVATTVHDDLGRPVLVTGAGTQPTSIAYSAWMQGAWRAGIEARIDDATGGSMVVDTNARGLSVERRRVGFGGQVSVTNAGYDAFGRVLWQSQPGWGTASASRTERTYDSLDRVRAVRAPDGALSTQTYTFFERTATDPQQRVRTIVQDADHRVVTAIDMHHGQPLSTTYTYVHGSQPEWVIDPENNLIHSVFDARGRRTLLEDPDAGVRSTRYDGFGDVVETGDGTGNATSYTLDRVGRVTEIASTVDGTTTLTWDTQPHGLGQLARTRSPDATIVDSYYDDIGRLTKTDWTVAGPVASMFSVEQTYDSNGRLEELRYPYVPNRPRMVVQPVYGDVSGGVSAVKAMGADGHWFEALKVNARNANNSLADAQLGDGIRTHRTYDPVSDRLATIETTGEPGAIVDFAYDYYNDGRLQHRKDKIANRVESFEYDDLRRLSTWGVEGGATTGYTYDTLGNLTGVEDQHGLQTEANLYTGRGPHQLNKREGMEYHYDARGRLDSSSADLLITYTDFDLPKSYKKGNDVTELSYDAGHHRVRKSGPSGTTIYIGGIYERREDAQGTKHVFTLSGPDGLVAQVVYDPTYPTQDTIEYLHQDPLGSVALATTATGAEIERLFYEPFGRRIDAHGQPLAGPTSDVLTGFTGQRHDDDLGLIDMRGRTYDPILRRFLQPDPVVQDAYAGQNYNRYSYVMNDPVNLIDPTGYKSATTWTDGAEGSIESDGTGAEFTEAQIVVTATPESPAEHLGTDGNGEGAAVQGAAALASTWYESSSTDQGLSTGGGGGSGGGVSPTGGSKVCQERDWSSAYLVYSPYAVKGLLYMSAALIGAAAAVATLPAMAIGGLSSGGLGLVGGATAVVAPAASAATSVAAAAGTPTGQAVLEEAENEGVDVARQVVATLPDKLFKPFQCKQCASAIVEALEERGIGGHLLDFKSNRGMELMVNELVSVSSPITADGTHQAVQVGDVVFDNYFRGGASYDGYIQALQAPWGVSLISKTPF